MSLNLIQKVKERFSELKKKIDEFDAAQETEQTTETTPTEQKFAELKLEDGSVIKTDTEELAKGSAVQVQNESGEFIPIPDGEYKCMLADGSMVAIKIEAGIVTEMMPVEAPATEEEPAEQEQAAESKDDYRAEIDAIKSEVAQLKEQIKALAENNGKLASDTESSKAIVISLQKENEALKKEVAMSKEVVKETLGIIELMSETPVTEPTQKPANATNAVKPFTDPLALRKSINNK